MAKKKINKKAVKATESDPGFEESLARLEAIAAELEEGSLGLEQALQRYEQGVRLLRRCYDLLDGAQRRIELLSGFDADGNPVSEPLEQERLSLEEKAKRRSRRRTSDDDSQRASPAAAAKSEDKPEALPDMDDSGRLF